jgi:hypothetical protein
MSDLAAASTRFPHRITLRTPEGLSEALEVAARHELTTPAEFARRALLKACRSAGVELRPNGKVQEHAA